MEFDMKVAVISGLVWVAISMGMWSTRYREVYGIGFTIFSMLIMLPIIYGIIWFQDNR